MSTSTEFEKRIQQIKQENLTELDLSHTKIEDLRDLLPVNSTERI